MEKTTTKEIGRKHEEREKYRVFVKSLELENFEYLHNGSTKWAHFSPNGRGMFAFQIHTNKVTENPCEVSLLISMRKVYFSPSPSRKQYT